MCWWSNIGSAPLLQQISYELTKEGSLWFIFADSCFFLVHFCGNFDGEATPTNLWFPWTDVWGHGRNIMASAWCEGHGFLVPEAWSPSSVWFASNKKPSQCTRVTPGYFERIPFKYGSKIGDHDVVEPVLQYLVQLVFKRRGKAPNQILNRFGDLENGWSWRSQARRDRNTLR